MSGKLLEIQRFCRIFIVLHIENDAFLGFRNNEEIKIVFKKYNARQNVVC